MKRIIRLTESDLTRIIRRIIKEGDGNDQPWFSLSRTRENQPNKNGSTNKADLEFVMGGNVYDLNHVVEWRCKNSENNNGKIVEMVSTHPATFNVTLKGIDGSKKNDYILGKVAYDRLENENLKRYCTDKGYK
jgi:hypothetical protein